MGGELPSASPLEGVRFTLQAMLPNVVQGLFRRRRRAVAAATKLNADGQAVGLLRGIRRARGPGPVWVRAGTDRMLLVLSTEHVRRVLEGSPEPFAPDPDAKRRGMSHFQPDALTISRGDAWRNRRRFAEAVLDTGRSAHRLADRFVSVTGEEVGAMLEEVATEEPPRLGWDAFQRSFARTTRRVVLGDAARDDEELGTLLAELMDEANSLPKEPSERLPVYLAKVRAHLDGAEDGSLAALSRDAPSDDATRVERQLTHWLFAMGDTLAANSFRALALIASHPAQQLEVEAELGAVGELSGDAVVSLGYLGACLQEAMRLWPTTPILSRETIAETEWDGATVPSGTQILISNTFNHRDPERHAFADRFAPEEWTDGSAGEDWSFNHLSHGPQGCPGADLALLVGKAALASLLRQRRISLLEPHLDPGKPLPHMLDFFALRFAVGPRT
jgi:cytochrome P450